MQWITAEEAALALEHLNPTLSAVVKELVESGQDKQTIMTHVNQSASTDSFLALFIENAIPHYQKGQ